MRVTHRPRPSVRRKISAGLAVISSAALGVLGVQGPAWAATPSTVASSAAASAASANAHIPVQAACGAPKKGDATCFALRRTDVKPFKGLAAAGTVPTGYGPSDLQSAYNLPANGGAGQTVAIVDAFDDPNAEADLAVYRQQYGLPACTAASGCFSKVSQRGGTDLPQPDTGWSTEISLDLDMVSAVAPEAHILLVEGDSANSDSLGAAAAEAVALGAKFVSNSYGTFYPNGSGEDPSETTTLDADYNHPGVAMVASSGDYGYGVSYPAASQYVTSVGGTSLVRDTSTSRGWSENAWSDAGSGCSLYEPKPSFQQDTGCAKRTVSDVSAVADFADPVAVYQTYGGGGWEPVGGTSVSAPIITSVYADAGTPVAGTYPNAYPYEASGAGINDVTGGSNGSCSPAYLCTGGTGYDGPTGLGTPNGLAAFRGAPHGVISGVVTDQTTGKPISDATVSVGSVVTTHSAADGSYKVSVPTGSYDVTVNHFGYAAGKVSAAVTAGGSLTENLALAPLLSQTVSGKVTDGSGHGWPLYAKITVDGAPGSVWTNPATGEYSLTLPQDRNYTLHVDASLPGYTQVTKALTVAEAPQTLDLAITSDPWQATTPGYAVHLSGSTETFDSTTSAPQGWNVVNANGTNGGWAFDDPGSLGNQTGGDGAFADVNSMYYGWSASQDSQLVSPVYDLTGKSDPELAFNTMYISNWNQFMTVDASSDGGATWTTLWTAPNGIYSDDRVEVPLTAFAGKSAVQLRFHFIGNGSYYWGLDNVFVGQRDYTPTPGGLVVGQVKDANTGGYVNGATVTSQDDPAVTTTSLATPDDPNLGGGLYTVFSPDLGNHTITAVKSHYTTASDAVDVQADSTVSAPLTLQAGQLTVTAGSLSASVAWGGQATKSVTVKNTGGEPATFQVGEHSDNFQMQAVGGGAPLQNVKGTFSTGPMTSGTTTATVQPASGSAGAAWQTGPDLPQTVMDSAVNTYNGEVYSGFGSTGHGFTGDLNVLDPTAGTWTKLASAPDRRDAPASGIIDGKLYAVGGWNQFGSTASGLDIYDIASNTWSTGAAIPKAYAGMGSAVADGRLYVVGGCTGSCGTTDAYAYNPSANTWTAVAPYPVPVAWEACAGITGKVYCAGGVNDSGGNVTGAYVYDPATDKWSALPSPPMSLWGSAYSSANGELVMSTGIGPSGATNQGYAFDPHVGTWTALPNANVAMYRGGGALGFYKVGGSSDGLDPTTTVEQLPGYDQPDASDVTWMSESAQQVTLQPGQSTTFTVALNSSVPEIAQPGTYSAALVLGSDTPYVAPNVPVTLQVAAPSSWGKITGTVLGLTAGGSSQPIAGATVQINGSASAYTLKTRADGTFALWLDVHTNPLSVIAADNGYQPAITSVKIKKGTTSTVTFTLKTS